MQRRAIELKVWRDGEADPQAKGLEQIDGYLAQLRLAAGGAGDLRPARGRKRRAVKPRFEEAVTPSGRRVMLLRA